MRAHKGEVGIVHQLSAGGRPYCGVEPEDAPAAERVAQPISCASCRRLLEDDARRVVHAGRPQADESED